MRQIPTIHNHRHHRPAARNLTAAVLEKDVKTEIKKNRIIRTLYLVGGTLSLIFAILGIVVPGLPVTPLALLSAFLYAKSSPKLYRWLLNSNLLGSRIRDYQRKKGITRKGKFGVIVFMTIMVLFSSFVVVGAGILRWTILFLGLVGCTVVIFFVPNAKEE